MVVDAGIRIRCDYHMSWISSTFMSQEVSSVFDCYEKTWCKERPANICIYTYLYTYMYIHVHVYREREREKARERDRERSGGGREGEREREGER